VIWVKPKLNARRVAAEIEATLDQHFQDQRDIFLAWVQGLHTASTAADYMRLQLEVRDRFAARQQVIQERRAACAADTARRDELVRRTPRHQTVIDDLQERIAIRQRLDVRDGVIQHIWRCLMDGLAWRVTSNDRALFTVMGDGERVGRLPAEVGAQPERDRAQAIWDRGAFPIITDLTNCLREGDLTVLHGDWRRPHVAIEEVKRSGDVSADTRQARRLDRKLQLLNTGASTGADGGPISLLRLPVAHRHHLDVLAAVLAQARRDGCADAQVHPGLVVSATDVVWALEHQDQAGNWMARAATAHGWVAGKNGCFWASALARRIRERRSAGSATLAPMAAFPLCAEDIVDILMGNMDYSVMISLDACRRTFSARGIEVSFATGSDAERIFLRGRRGPDDVAMPAVMREQMLHELTSLDTIVETVDELLKSVSAGLGTDRHVVVCDEATSWPSPPGLSRGLT
jgi:hypothetical protein